MTESNSSAPAAPGSRGSPRYVGFGPRFLAFLADSVAALLVITPIALLLLGDGPVANIDPADPLAALQSSSARLMTDSLLMAVLVLGFWIWRAATPGKMLIRAEIRMAGSLARPGMTTVIIRYLAYYVSIAAFGLGFLWIIFDARKQGWHDKLAGTVVIRVDD